MKKLLLLSLAMGYLAFGNANPIIPPPIISEIYFEENIWTLEFSCISLQNWAVDNLDELRIKCSTGEAEFIDGIVVEGECLIITQDDLLSDLYINKDGDYLVIQHQYGDYWYDLGDYLYFGEIQYSNVNTPSPGQSLVVVEITYGDPWYPDHAYWLVQENSPSLGYNPYEVTSMATFQGYVLDLQGNPVNGAQVRYCDDLFLGMTLTGIYTNASGYYQHPMYGRNYDVDIVYEGISIYDTVLTMEPGIINQCDFHVDTSLVGVNNVNPYKNIDLVCVPNPFASQILLQATIPASIWFFQPTFEIYNLNGQLIGQISDVPFNAERNSRVIHATWQPTAIKPGEYVLILLLDGVRIKEEKIIKVL